MTDNMLEYVLFHQQPFNQFIEFLSDLKVKTATSENEGIFEIRIEDNLERGICDLIEKKYDELMALNQELFFAENPATAENYRMATLMFTLASGELSSAHVRPELLAKVLEVISQDELHEIVEAVVKGVEDPDDRSYCQKVRAGDVSFDDPT